MGYFSNVCYVELPDPTPGESLIVATLEPNKVQLIGLEQQQKKNIDIEALGQLSITLDSLVEPAMPVSGVPAPDTVEIGMQSTLFQIFV